MDASSDYLTRVQKLPLLTREQEFSLSRRWREQGDVVARNELVQSHLRIVVPIARRYHRPGASLIELVAEGSLGLLHASAKFEPERGYRFATYANYWVRAYVAECAVQNSGSVLRSSRALRKVRREHARAINLVGEGAEARQLVAERLSMSTRQADELVNLLEQHRVPFESVHLERRAPIDEPLCAREPSPEQAISDNREQGFLEEAVRDALAHLDPRERRIVERRLTADVDAMLTLEELGREFGVSRERVRQLEARLKLKLVAHFRALSKVAGSWAPDVAA